LSVHEGGAIWNESPGFTPYHSHESLCFHEADEGGLQLTFLSPTPVFLISYRSQIVSI